MNNRAEKALKVLTKIWGRRSGYVFLPWIDGDCKSAEDRRKSYHEGRAFYWPREKEAILEHMKNRENDDLYFCPNLFEMKRRSSNFAREERAIWADLDSVDPREIDPDLQPTVAWQSSPGRYQAIWLLTTDALLASEPATGKGFSGLSQRMTYHIGADLGGWDATQLLRPPGWNNHKPEYREKYGETGAPGKLLWSSGPKYDPAELHEDLPEVTFTYESEDVLEQEIEAVNRLEVMANISMKLPTEVKRLIRARESQGDRSQKLFYIEQSLAEVGCTLSEIVAIVRPTVWNKFAGRNDELKRLKLEAAKAIEKTRRETEDEEDIFEVVEVEDVQNLFYLVLNVPNPRWLIDDIWTVGSCGFIAGEPKSFKSYFALDMALSIATGYDFLNSFKVKQPGPVLYIQEEDPLPTLRERLGQIGPPKHRLLDPLGAMIMGNDGFTWHPPMEVDIDAYVRRGVILSQPEWREWLDEQLSRKDYRALILDPMMILAGDVEENRSSDMTSYFFNPLKQLAEKYQCAVILVHHMGKGQGRGRQGQRMLGSTANFAWVEDSLYISKTGDSNSKPLKVFRESKNATAKFFKVMPKIERHLWLPEVILGEGDDSGGGEDKGNNGTSTHQALIELGQGSHSVDVITELAGITASTVRSQLSRLKKQGLVDNDNKGDWWLIT